VCMCVFVLYAVLEARYVLAMDPNGTHLPSFVYTSLCLLGSLSLSLSFSSFLAAHQLQLTDTVQVP